MTYIDHAVDISTIFSIKNDYCLNNNKKLYCCIISVSVPPSALCEDLQHPSLPLHGPGGSGRSFGLPVAAAGTFLWHHLASQATNVRRRRPVTFHMTGDLLPLM